MTAVGERRPHPGPRNPVLDTPPRAPGSVRRTTSIDTTFPDGLGNDVVICVRGRDLRTSKAGEAAVLDQLDVTFVVDPWTATITAAPLDGFVGISLRGLRRRLADLLPEDAARRSLRYSALEDVAGAYLVSGYAGLRNGHIEPTAENAELAVQGQSDVCIGWAADGPVIEMIRETHEHPVPIGPAAPEPNDTDALAWHEMPPLRSPSVRRRRRTDVHGDAGLHAEHHLRDSYADTDAEYVMHEYLVGATFGAGGTLESIDVDARVLPWRECPGAVATAQRLVGVQLGEMAARVTADFKGVQTCTHLNSTLRTLADVQTLHQAR
jgi:hypothetical protein